MKKKQFRRISIECMLDETRINDPDFIGQSSYESSSISQGIYSTYSVFTRLDSEHQKRKQIHPGINTLDYESFEIKLKYTSKPQEDIDTHNQSPFEHVNGDKKHQVDPNKHKQEQAPNDILLISSYIIGGKDLAPCQLKSTQNKHRNISGKQNLWSKTLGEDRKNQAKQRLEDLKKDFETYNHLHGLKPAKCINNNECCQIM